MFAKTQLRYIEKAVSKLKADGWQDVRVDMTNFVMEVSAPCMTIPQQADIFRILNGITSYFAVDKSHSVIKTKDGNVILEMRFQTYALKRKYIREALTKEWENK